MEIRDAGVRSDPHCSASHLAYLHDRRNEGIWLGAVLALIYAALRWNKKENSGLLLKSALLSAFAGGWAGYVFQWLWADGAGVNTSLFYMLLFGILLTISWLQFHSPLSRFLTLGLGRNGAVQLIMGALFVWVIYDFAFTSASEREAIVSPNVEGNPATIAEGLKPDFAHRIFR